MTEQVSCIICGQSESKALFCSKSFMYPNESFTLVQCVKCGLAFLNPRPTIDGIGKYYENYHLHVDISNLSRFAKQILLIETIGHNRYETKTENNKLLEIGFGDGLFLEYMKNKKWDVYGIEIEEPCVKKLKKTGIENVYTGNIFSVSFDNKTFDLVRMNQTLEHMHDPLKVLIEVKRILKEDGKLIIAVPNFAGASHRMFKQFAYSLHVPFHLYFFDLETLGKLIDKVGGFKIVRVHRNNSLVLFLASAVQYLKRNKNTGSSSYNFSATKLIIHRLIGLVALPFMKVMDLFIEGDNLEVEIARI